MYNATVVCRVLIVPFMELKVMPYFLGSQCAEVLIVPFMELKEDGMYRGAACSRS